MQYHPHDYQTYATNFILEHPVAAVLLEMGLGKSVCTLTAIYELMLNRFEVESVLVIAPLRVARDTWPAEIEKWDHLKGLTYSVVIGTEAERIAALNRPAHIYLINRENVDWLISKSGVPFDLPGRWNCISRPMPDSTARDRRRQWSSTISLQRTPSMKM